VVHKWCIFGVVYEPVHRVGGGGRQTVPTNDVQPESESFPSTGALYILARKKWKKTPLDGCFPAAVKIHDVAVYCRVLWHLLAASL
jgi:hypothetical protein